MIDSFSGNYRFLSNFYPAEVEHEGVRYPTTEHAFQAAKALDPSKREEIREADTPRLAKQLGRTVELRADWEEIKLDVMLGVVRRKFRNPDLRQKLLDTDNAELVEGNTWGDSFWGVCEGRGQNQLGRILMRVRAEIRASRLRDGSSL